MKGSYENSYNKLNNILLIPVSVTENPFLVSQRVVQRLAVCMTC